MHNLGRTNNQFTFVETSLVSLNVIFIVENFDPQGFLKKLNSVNKEFIFEEILMIRSCLLY